MKRIDFKALDARVAGYLLDDHDSLKAHKTRPVLVICPGGAYRFCSPREADAPALEFLALGWQVFVIEYTCQPKDMSNFRPLRELAELVRILRESAGDWHIERDKIAVMGFSAGGHLAASLGAFWNDPDIGLPASCHPNALVLCYPVVSTREFAHEESAENVSAGDQACRDKLHLWERITADFPPTFLWHGGEDESVPPENSLNLAVELKKHGVPFEYHLFGSGRHGISTCTQEVESPDPVCREWVKLCQTWLCRQFDFVP